MPLPVAPLCALLCSPDASAKLRLVCAASPCAACAPVLCTLCALPPALDEVIVPGMFCCCCCCCCWARVFTCSFRIVPFDMPQRCHSQRHCPHGCHNLRPRPLPLFVCVCVCVCSKRASSFNAKLWHPQHASNPLFLSLLSLPSLFFVPPLDTEISTVPSSTYLSLFRTPHTHTRGHTHSRSRVEISILKTSINSALSLTSGNTFD